MKLELQNDRDSYFSRNQRWLQPALAGLIFLLAPQLMDIISPDFVLFPAWLPIVAAAVAFVVSGIFAAICDTFSALFVRVLAQAVAIGLLLWLVFFRYRIRESRAKGATKARQWTRQHRERPHVRARNYHSFEPDPKPDCEPALSAIAT